MKAKNKTDKEVIKDEIIADNNQDSPTEQSGNTVKDECKNDSSEDLQQKCEELNDKNLRLMAEFDNFRKRTLKEKADLIKYSGERIFTDMLPLIDDLERALLAAETAEDVTAIKEGVKFIYNKFSNFLDINGVKTIPTDNEPFNVDVHEAINILPVTDEDMKGKIVDCAAKGYTLNDKVIRFAKVVVGE